MRTIINISLPEAMAKELKREVKREGYVSVSEFFRKLWRDQKERELLAEIEESRREIETGKAKLLSSLRDLR